MKNLLAIFKLVSYRLDTETRKCNIFLSNIDDSIAKFL